MPIYCFKCPRGHRVERIRDKPYKNVRRFRCVKCGLWSVRDYPAEHSTGRHQLNLDYKNDPISHLSRKRSFKGVWTENLTPEPVFIKDAAQYQKLLKDTNSREKHS
jgi:hypothetical protein